MRRIHRESRSPAAAAKTGPERRGQTADASLDHEALVLQFLTQQVRREPFLNADLGSIPELVGDTGQLAAVRLDRFVCKLYIIRRDGPSMVFLLHFSIPQHSPIQQWRSTPIIQSLDALVVIPSETGVIRFCFGSRKRFNAGSLFCFLLCWRVISV